MSRVWGEKTRSPVQHGHVGTVENYEQKNDKKKEPVDVVNVGDGIRRQGE